jgi:acyl carrier protein
MREQVFAVITAQIGRIVEGAADRTITEDMSMKDLGADSLEIVEVVSRSMKELRIRVPRTDLSSAKNLKDLVDLFEQALSSQAAGT